MDRIGRGYANSYSVPSKASKHQSEASVATRLGRLFQEQNEQYVGSATVIFAPKSYDDVSKIIDHLKRGEQVIVDFSTTNQGVVGRILDFMSGAVYALGGSVRRITADIFLFSQGVMVYPNASNR
ncbi:MAG: cell division protein SepF [Clostridia bacterium]|nr:cell division protein SepF [Clostridia bacterium]